MPRELLMRTPATEIGAATMVGEARPSTSTTFTPMLKATFPPSCLARGAAARLLADDDQDRFGRLDRVEVDLDGEIAEIDLVRGVVLRVALDAEHLVRRVGAEGPTPPQAEQERGDHVEFDASPQLVCVRLLAYEPEPDAQR